MPKKVQVNNHIVEFPDDMSPDAIKFVLHQNMGKLSDTQYHMDRDPFYQKASEQAGSQEPPASISRQIGVTPKFTDSGYYQFPGRTAPRRAPFRGDDQQPHEFKDYRIEAIPKPTIQTAIPEGAEIKAQDVGVLGRKSQIGRDKTLGEIISYIKDAPNIKERTDRLRESIGRFVAPLVGLDYDEEAARKIYRAIIPLAPPSESGSTLLKTKINVGGREITPKIVDPERFSQEHAFGHSMIIDPRGHVIDVSPATHGEAAEAMEGKRLLDNKDFLEKHKFIRLSKAENMTAVEMYHQPTPQQVESLMQSAENTAKHPDPIFAYDLASPTKGRTMSRSGLTAGQFIDDVLTHYAQ